MKRKYKLMLLLILIAVLISTFAVPALALTEKEVQDKVAEVGKDAVTGNIFVWFLCAIAFLKVSQKIDSFMSSLGINVGNTGGSMLGEMMIAARSIGAVKGLAGKENSGHSSSGSTSAMQGGLAGIVSRKFTGSAVKQANGSSGGGLGGMAFRSSVSKGGGFANKVIGSIATGSIASSGSISGANASNALTSYLGYTALGKNASDVPKFSNAEIGGGHIFATETSEEYPNGIAIGMYHTTQYMPPDGEYTTVTAADGTLWYKQYAADTVERKPYHTEDGSVAYHETIVKKLPNAPKRKDKV